MKAVDLRQPADTSTGLILGDQPLQLGRGEPPLSLPQHSHVRTLRQRAATFEGGAAYLRDPESDLFLLAATNMVGEDTFYEAAANRDARFVDLVHRVTATNPAFTAGDPAAGKVGLAQYLRDHRSLAEALHEVERHGACVVDLGPGFRREPGATDLVLERISA